MFSIAKPSSHIKTIVQEGQVLHRQRTGPNVSVTGPPDPSTVDRVMQLQQSHPPILVGAGSRWMLGIAGREADIVCHLPRALPEGRSLGSTKRSPQRMVRKVEWVELAAEHLAGTDNLVPAAGPHRLTVCKSDWQISGKRQLLAPQA
jgi:alkanesulfonate monooxygenase SsuD/methylene tetrahydromethanopterin reductase-like flavin-dependent oxidoreductase (luciferase family)